MRRFAPFLFASIAVACGSSSSSGGPPPNDGGSDADPFDFARAPNSCAFTCDCDETPDKPYACPSLGDWGQIPHDSACPAWDGKPPPAQTGKCTASAPAGEAVKYAGADADHPGTFILPDGRRITPAGEEWVFADLKGGLPANVIALPSSSLVVVVEDGYGTHAVRLVDPAKIDGKTDPTVSIVKFEDPETLNSGVAFVAPDRLFVATADGVVQAITVDLGKQTLTRDDAHSVKLPPPKSGSGSWYASGVAASPDGTKLVVSAVKERTLLVYDVTKDAATYGTQLGSVDVGGTESFGAYFDPKDASGRYAYVTLWADKNVAEVDLSDPKAPKVSRTFAVDKDPEGVAFLDARWMAVANDHGDSIALVDRVSGAVTEVNVGAEAPLHGDEPSMLAWDATNHRLYATFAGMNAVGAWDVDLSASPPKLAPLGRLPTAWWPGGVAVQPDGSLVVVDMRGHGRGANTTHYGIDDGDIMTTVRGSIQRVPMPSAADLTSGDAQVTSNDVGIFAQGAPTVSCPDGADDFPVPTTNTKGPSKVIDHVIYVVRENKAFDGVLGDLPGVEGSPDLTFVGTDQMDKIWRNFRQIVKTFATSDDYYIDAELSVQGHIWTTDGRSNDYCERTWAMDGDGRDPRHDPAPDVNILGVGKPAEGSIFDWLEINHVPYGIFGEGSSLPDKRAGVPSSVDNDYPGGFIQSIDYPDIEKACYLAGRLRVTCDLPGFVYATMPNDHTHGVRNGTVTPETMISVNDEATGMLVDAVSHSPFWKSTLIVVLEDDPSQGGDHIDNHRSPIAFVSPWVKRGYVSKTHIDVSSVHKLFAHVLGLPYPNAVVANAPLPLDLFTSTPDFSPYSYQPRVLPTVCATAATKAEETLTSSWDFSRVDAQPGLDGQVARWLKGAQWTTLPPAVEKAVAVRKARRALTVGGVVEDDDD